MRSRSLVPVVLATLSMPACVPDPAGVWVLTFPWASDEPETCEVEYEENFSLAAQPVDTDADTDEWTTTSEISSGADNLAFAQIITASKTEAVLVVDDLAYPGVWRDDAWEFKWEVLDEWVEIDDHVTGYTYGEYESNESSSSVTFRPDKKNTASGTWKSSTSQLLAWQESDTWGAVVAESIGTTGQMPSSTYLVYYDTTLAAEVPQVNDGAVEDCSGELCKLFVTTACSSSAGFTALRTDYEDEDVYGALEDAGQ